MEPRISQLPPKPGAAAHRPLAHSIATALRHSQLQAARHIVLMRSRNFSVCRTTHKQNLLSSYRAGRASHATLNARVSNCYDHPPHTHTQNDPHTTHTRTHPWPSMAPIEGCTQWLCTCQCTHLATTPGHRPRHTALRTPLGTARCLLPHASWPHTAYAFTSAHPH